MNEDLIRAEALERVADQLQSGHSEDPYLRWGVAHTIAYLREGARVHRIHAREREVPQAAPAVTSERGAVPRTSLAAADGSASRL